MASKWKFVVGFSNVVTKKVFNFYFLFNVHGSVHRKNILIYVQQDATVHSLLYLETALHVFNVCGSVHRNNILIYIQQDATLHSLLYLETALHVSGGTTTHHQEHIQLYLQHLVFVTPLLLPEATGR